MSVAPPTDTPSPLPRDARLIALLLAHSGAEDSDEGVVRMLVEYAHRYTTEVLTDSLLYAEHAKSGQPGAAAAVPSLDDVRLACQARKEGSQVSKEFLLSLASTVNAVPLPSISEVFGVRLPPPTHRLTAPNFTLAPRSNVGTTGDGAAGVAGAGGAEGAGGDGAGEDDDDDAEGDGLFGDDDDDEDEEMEDATADYPAGPNGLSGGAGGEGGVKRARDSEDEEFEEV